MFPDPYNTQGAKEKEQTLKRHYGADGLINRPQTSENSYQNVYPYSINNLYHEKKQEDLQHVPNVKVEWTEQEEMIFIDLHHKIGNKWAEISQHLSGKTDNCVKNHFYSRMRKLQRKLNKIIFQYFKKQFRPIDITMVYKIIEAVEERFKEKPGCSLQVSQECSKVQNDMLEMSMQKQYEQGCQQQYTEYELQQYQQLISDIYRVCKLYKRKSKKVRNSLIKAPSNAHRKRKKQVIEAVANQTSIKREQNEQSEQQEPMSSQQEINKYIRPNPLLFPMNQVVCQNKILVNNKSVPQSESKVEKSGREGFARDSTHNKARKENSMWIQSGKEMEELLKTTGLLCYKSSSQGPGQKRESTERQGASKKQRRQSFNRNTGIVFHRSRYCWVQTLHSSSPHSQGGNSDYENAQSSYSNGFSVYSSQHQPMNHFHSPNYFLSGSALPAFPYESPLMSHPSSASLVSGAAFVDSGLNNYWQGNMQAFHDQTLLEPNCHYQEQLPNPDRQNDLIIWEKREKSLSRKRNGNNILQISENSSFRSYSSIGDDNYRKNIRVIKDNDQSDSIRSQKSNLNKVHFEDEDKRDVDCYHQSDLYRQNSHQSLSQGSSVSITISRRGKICRDQSQSLSCEPQKLQKEPFQRFPEKESSAQKGQNNNSSKAKNSIKDREVSETQGLSSIGNEGGVKRKGTNRNSSTRPTVCQYKEI